MLFDDAVVWLTNPSPNKNMSFILRLLFHASLHMLWREREILGITTPPLVRPASSLISDIQNIIRCRLDPLSRAQRNKPNVTSYLST
ncbi:unnamed protein product, partial [Brassica rapa subsp. trilocularis]